MNPFDELGLKRDLVEELYQTGKLDAFLKKFFHLVQQNVHPDKNEGKGELSKLVNKAYDEIRQSPDKIQEWISSMQEGNDEYIDVIDELVRKVEKLKSLENENEMLRKRVVELLCSNSGRDGHESWDDVYITFEELKKPGEEPFIETESATAKDEDDVELIFVEGSETHEEPGKTYSEKTPPDPPRRVKVTDSGDFFILKDIVCFNYQGKPFEVYPQLEIAKDCLRHEESPVIMSRNAAVSRFNALEDGSFLPSFALQCAILEALYQNRTLPGSKEILKSYYEMHGPGNSNTVVIAKENGGTIIHYPDDVGRRVELPYRIHGPGFLDAMATVLTESFVETFSFGFTVSPRSNFSIQTEFVRNVTGRFNPSILAAIGKYLRREYKHLDKKTKMENEPYLGYLPTEGTETINGTTFKGLNNYFCITTIDKYYEQPTRRVRNVG